MRNTLAADIRQDDERSEEIGHNGQRWLTIVDVFTWRERVNDFLRNAITYFLINATLITIVFFSISHIVLPHKFSPIGGDHKSLTKLWYGFSIFWGLLTAFYNSMLVVQGFKWIRHLWRPSKNAREIYLKRSESRQMSTRVAQKRRADAVTPNIERVGRQNNPTEDIYSRADRTISWLDVTVGPVDRTDEAQRSVQSRYSMVRNEANINRRRKVTSPDLYSIGRPGSQLDYRADKGTSFIGGMDVKEGFHANQSTRPLSIPIPIYGNDQVDGFPFPCMPDAGPSLCPYRGYDGHDETKDDNQVGSSQSVTSQELENMQSDIAPSEARSTENSMGSRLSFHSVTSKHIDVDDVTVLEDHTSGIEMNKFESSCSNQQQQSHVSEHPIRRSVYIPEQVMPSLNLDGPGSDRMVWKRPKLSNRRRNTRVLAYDIVTEHFAKRNRISNKRRTILLTCIVLSPLITMLSVAFVVIPVFITCWGPKTMHDYMFDHACGADTWDIRLVGRPLLGTKDHVQAYFKSPQTQESFRMLLQPVHDVRKSSSLLLYLSSSNQLYKYNHQDKQFVEEIFPLLVQYDFQNSTYWTPKTVPAGVSALEPEYFKDFSLFRVSDRALVMDPRSYSFPSENLWIDVLEKDGECGEPKVVLKDQSNQPFIWTVLRKRTDCAQLKMCAIQGASRRQVVVVAGKVLQRMMAVTECCSGKDKF